MSEESAPTYGALPYCQFHFVVPGDGSIPDEELIARTRRKTKGVVRKKVTDVWWEGGNIAQRLNADSMLRSLLTTVLLEEGNIHIDPTPSGVRIYSGWKPEYKLQPGRETLEAYDRIAGHVKRYMEELRPS